MFSEIGRPKTSPEVGKPRIPPEVRRPKHLPRSTAQKIAALGDGIVSIVELGLQFVALVPQLFDVLLQLGSLKQVG